MVVITSQRCEIGYLIWLSRGGFVFEYCNINENVLAAASFIFTAPHTHTHTHTGKMTRLIGTLLLSKKKYARAVISVGVSQYSKTSDIYTNDRKLTPWS